MEADREPGRDELAALGRGQQHVLAAQLASVARQHQLAAVQEAEAARIAVVAGVDPARSVAFLPRKFDFANPASERPIGVNRGRIAVADGQRGMRRRGPQALGQRRRQLHDAHARAAAINDDAVWAIGKFERERRSATALDQACHRRRRGIQDRYGRSGGEPLIPPVARLAQRAGAHAACLDNLLEPFHADRRAALPASQIPVAKTHAEQCRDQRLDRAADARRRLQPPCGINLSQLRQQHQQIDLRRRRARDIAAVIEDRDSDRLCQRRFDRAAPRIAAGNEQARRHHAAQRRDARRTGGNFVGTAIDMARTPGERVEHAAAIDEVGRGQDQRRVCRPEQDAPAPQIGAPGRFAHLVGMRVEPAPHQRFGHRRRLRARRHRRKVAQP